MKLHAANSKASCTLQTKVVPFVKQNLKDGDGE
jgi:hypothetical protein